MPDIHYSADREFFYVTREGSEPKWVFATRVAAGHRAQQERPGGEYDNLFTGWLHVTTKDGRSYSRACYAIESNELQTPHVEPLPEQSFEFKDYALFHQWPMPA